MSTRISIQPTKGSVAVIGAGIFGLAIATKLADKGCNVCIYEKEHDALLGASYINQNRVHRGYHYPRSMLTAYSSSIYQKSFCRTYEEAIVRNFEHYYCISDRNSLTSAKKYLNFCDTLELPYEIKYPKDITIKSVSTSLKVQESVYDANLLRNRMKKDTNKENIVSFYSTEVTKIKKINNMYEINGDREHDAVINATYSNINSIIELVDLPMSKYKYELCEVVIVKVPWKKRIGCTIMDGKFFGVLPFGFSEEYMLYDVEYTVLEDCCGFFPDFKHSLDYYDQKTRRESRYSRYIKKASNFIEEMKNARYLYSIYVPKVILPDKELDDGRPTEIISHGEGFWSIFSGKICAALPVSDRIAREVEQYLCN